MPDELEIHPNVSPSLHPHLIDKLGAETEMFAISGVRDAFASAYASVAKVHTARDAAFDDPTLTKEAALLKADDLAERLLLQVTKSFDGARVTLAKAIQHTEAELATPVETQASAQIAKEVRDYVKGLSAGERITFVRGLIEKGDTKSASAVLGGPAFLSGLDDGMHGTLTRLFHEHNTPLTAKRLRAMHGAMEMLDRNAPLIFDEMQKAVGTIAIPSEHGGKVRHITPSEVRKKRDASAKVFATLA